MYAMPIERYRPSLTALQIQTIIHAFKQIPQSAEVRDVLATLVPFEAKIVNGIKSPVSSVETLDEKLGWTAAPAGPEELRKQAYEKWQDSPESCTLLELQRVADYRFTHGLMDAEEQTQHLSKLTEGMN